jgi:hypothetical protein
VPLGALWALTRQVCRKQQVRGNLRSAYIAREGGRERRGLYRCGWVGKQAARTSRRLASALALIPCAMRRRRTAPLLAARARMGLSGAAAPRSQRTIAPTMGAIVQMISSNA